MQSGMLRAAARKSNKEALFGKAQTVLSSLFPLLTFSLTIVNQPVQPLNRDLNTFTFLALRILCTFSIQIIVFWELI